MKPTHVTLRQIGNSQGIVIPKPLLAQVGLIDESAVEISVENGTLVLRKPRRPVRAGWAEAARAIAERGEDTLVMGEFGNEGDDTEIVW
ncbi:AbrB/MazE/SpoVT family DNA-binding domain-containing protein [Sphaerotilus sp.]|uniref:AbrB/MazE/SpoVT family DNA-binding domain-containing protein n=1 Tax=Sphaerotilus sp. TaxID=2093942 RepID=UPI0025FB24E3|nr:AbrB/MazE/SpoVT family DNA-binding domain-containing protein [Sphaerotilus sp.]